jgi:hypothetical protein
MRQGETDWTRRVFLGSGAGGVVFAAAPPQPAASMRLAHTKTESVACLFGRQHLFDYRYSPTRPKTYIHPLFLPNGVPVTLDGTEDHIHHRGLMIAWTNVNGYDFWGELDAGEKGRIVHERFDRLEPGPPAELTAVNHWVGGGKVLLAEKRTIRIPRPTADHVLLGWTSELSAPEAAVVLNAQRAPYDGLGIRFPYSMSEGSVLNSNGTSEVKKAHGEAAQWCAFSGPCGRDGEGGVVIFDHPGNPRHPTPFAVYRNAKMGYISAAPTFSDPKLNIPAGGAIRFRYGVAAFLGRPKRQEMDALFREWTRSEGRWT